MRKLAIALALAAMPMMAQSGPYVSKGWVWVDPQDKQGKWDPIRASDKRGHQIMGGLSASWVYMYAERQGWKHPEWWGVAAGVLVGWLKEIYDLRYGSGTAERADWLNTAIGGVAGVTIVRIKW